MFWKRVVRSITIIVVSAVPSVILGCPSAPQLKQPSVLWFSINDGLGGTSSPTVTLNNACLNGPTQYMASESSTFEGAVWRLYSTAPNFTLSSGDGTKTVYFKVKNGAGESSAKSDTIPLIEVVDMTEETIMLPGDVPLVMVWIPAGTFMMGPDQYESYPRNVPHQVTLTNGYWIGKYELTWRQWFAVMGSIPPVKDNEESSFPVSMATWIDTQSFISTLNTVTGLTFRLPSEAEWEYACRAGTSTDYYWGENLDGCHLYSVITGFPLTYVGTKLPNKWGLYDMIGNVAEWCEDWYAHYPTEAVTDPTGPSTGNDKVMRGGAWSNDYPCCASYYREWHDALDAWNNEFGFRLAR